MYIRKNDTVQVTRGSDKGRNGRVIAVYPKKSRVLVEGVNVRKRHTRPNRNNQQGGIIESEAPIHISNVAAWNPDTGHASKIKMKRLEDGRRIRVWHDTGEAVD